eukprot:tig00020927_g15961.t1
MAQQQAFIAPIGLPRSSQAADQLELRDLAFDGFSSLRVQFYMWRLPRYDVEKAFAVRENAVFVASKSRRCILPPLPTTQLTQLCAGRAPNVVDLPSFQPGNISIGDIIEASPAKASYKQLTQLATVGLAPTSISFATPFKAVADSTPINELVLQRASGHANDQPRSGKKGTVLVWFRNDLRIHDHAALHEALENASTVVPVFCFDPRQFGKTSFGFEKTGRYRAKFLVESVQDLRATLESIGSGLVIRHGIPEEELPKLCRELKATAVYCHKEVTFEEQEVENAVIAKLKNQGMVLRAFWGNTLYHENDLPFSVDTMPDVYTDFRRSVEAGGSIRKPIAAPELMKQLPQLTAGQGAVPTLQELGLSEPPAGMSAPLSSFIGGETEAVRRLEQYLAEGPQRTEGATVKLDDKSTASLVPDFSCKISPWLALGCLSPRRIYEDVRAKCAQEPRTGSVYYELVWRDFFRFITKKYGNAKCVSFSKEGAAAAPAAAAAAAPAELVAA